jgi:hypothetical protein
MAQVQKGRMVLEWLRLKKSQVSIGTSIVKWDLLDLTWECVNREVMIIFVFLFYPISRLKTDKT